MLLGRRRRGANRITKEEEKASKYFALQKIFLFGGIIQYFLLLGLNLHRIELESVTKICGPLLIAVGVILWAFSRYELSSSSELIETGIYGIIRHPISFATLIIFSGITLLGLSFSAICGWIILIFCLIVVNKAEEKDNLEKFGNEYEEYMERVPMWNFFKGIIRRDK
jgi:protein-S-isoprenylcysteine O-methyltransferase Ste14